MNEKTFVCAGFGQEFLPAYTVESKLSPASMKYKIVGGERQSVEIYLDAGEEVKSESSAMEYRIGQVHIETKYNWRLLFNWEWDGFQGFGFDNVYQNVGNDIATVCISPRNGGQILAIDLSIYGSLLVTPGLFWASLGNIQSTYKVQSHTDLIQISGTGIVFLTGHGCLNLIHLRDCDEMFLEFDTLVGFNANMRYDYRYETSSNCLTFCLGGQSIYGKFVNGPGIVITQSMRK
ncbi:tryptophan RNA-binding attenuator protein-like domain-containing protein [Globomyces pollinis-pini]|nr:tryptophan RNA-binding attenuator protein-like domain-containing protein [Globomyces pollinis-pini]